MMKLNTYLFYNLTLILGLLFGIQLNAYAQSCQIHASASPETIFCGQTSVLSVYAYGDGTVMMDEDFNSGGFGPGWSSTPGAVMWNNPCSPGGVDGTPHAWMGSNTSVPRDIVTANYDLTAATAGVTVCFDLLFATQAQAAPCEGPDEPDEGVYFQYSIDNGATWVTINYFNPQGGYNTPYTQWDNWCFAIPAAAITSSTQFRWHQDDDSGQEYDHWGIDNVQIVQNDVNATVEWGSPGDAYYHNYGVGSSGGENPNHVSPTTTTTYDVQITTGSGDVCTDQVTVTVIDPVYEVDVSITPTPLCVGDCADITGSAVQVIDPGGIKNFQNSEIKEVFGTPNNPIPIVGGPGSIKANMNINVQGLNGQTPQEAPILEVCLKKLYFTSGLGCSNVTLADIKIVLECPGGTQIILADVGQLSGFDVTNMCFETGGAPLSSATPPFTGTFAPNEPFSNLDGCASNGVWKMRVIGVNNETCVPAGFLTGWSITFDDPPIHSPVDAVWSPTTGLTPGTIVDASNIYTQTCPTTTTTYDLTVSNGVTGCATHTEPIEVTVSSCDCVLPNLIVHDLTGCVVDLSDAIDPASDPATITFYTNQTDANNATSAIGNSVTTSGSYWIRAEDPNDPTCYVVDEIQVNITSVDFTVTVTNPSCGALDGEIVITPGSGVTIATYSIDNGATTQTNGTFSNLGAGSYTIVVVDANGCEETSTESLSNAGGATIDNISTTDPSCSNDDGELEATVSGGATPYSYQWYDDAGNPIGTNSNTITGLAAGDYSVEVTDGDNCTSTGSATLNPAAGSDDASFTLTNFCEGEANSATITGTPGGTFTILSPTGDGATINTTTGEITDGVGGTTYTVEYETNGACPSSETNNVTVNIAPAFTVSTTSPSCGALDGEIVITPGSGVMVSTYSIDNGATTQTNGTFSNLGAGSYAIVIVDANGCENTQTENLSNAGGPTIADITVVNASCNSDDGAISVLASGGTAPLSYSLNSGQTSSDGTFTGLTDGSYTVTVSDANGCDVNETVVVDREGGLTLSIIDSENVSCFGLSDGSATVGVTGGTPTYSYSWSSGGTNSPSATGLSAGVHTITVTDSQNCSEEISVVISEPSTIVLDATVVDSDCGMDNGSIIVEATGGAGNYLYSWSPSVSNSHQATNIGVGSYEVTVTDGNGCSETATYVVELGGSFYIDAIPSETTINQGESVPLYLVVDPNVTVDVISWSPSTSLSCSDCTDPIATPEVTTTYVVEVMDDNGCISTDTVTVNVILPCSDVFVPNSFSPNGDGLNDFQCVLGSCITSLEFIIFNRWGETIFQTNDQKECWDGTFRGKPVQSGVYTYKLRANSKDQGEIEQTGNITVVS